MTNLFTRMRELIDTAEAEVGRIEDSLNEVWLVMVPYEGRDNVRAVHATEAGADEHAGRINDDEHRKHAADQAYAMHMDVCRDCARGDEGVEHWLRQRVAETIERGARELDEKIMKGNDEGRGPPSGLRGVPLELVSPKTPQPGDAGAIQRYRRVIVGPIECPTMFRIPLFTASGGYVEVPLTPQAARWVATLKRSKELAIGAPFNGWVDRCEAGLIAAHFLQLALQSVVSS